MAPKYTHAIVQRISSSLQEIGDIDLEIAKKQHEAYVNILREIGLDVIELPPDDELPQGIFVESAAVICNGVALIARSKDTTRQKEILLHFYSLSGYKLRLPTGPFGKTSPAL
uniref:Uncharacterized protein n=1 Tax=Megaselia scalaris TaxID=36166 RepID=T1GRY3_MEGSC